MDSQVVTLAQLIATVRQRADISSSQFITDPELTGYLNASASELWDLLVTAYGEEYQTASAVLTSTGAGTIPLPPDFLKSEGAEVAASAGGPPRSLKRIPWSDRNKFWSNWTGQLAAYCIRGSNIYLFPAPPAGQQIILYYVPRAPVLGNTAVAIISRNTGASSSITINGQVFSGGDSNALALSIFANMSNVPPESPLYGLSCNYIANPANDVTLTVTLADGASLSWSTNSSQILLTPPRASAAMDGMNGWAEYVVLDAVIKCKAKDDEDAALEVSLKEAMHQRIKAVSSNRDSGGIPVADTRASDDPYFGWNSRWGY
jgi:hypothetical protein